MGEVIRVVAVFPTNDAAALVAALPSLGLRKVSDLADQRYLKVFYASGQSSAFDQLAFRPEVMSILTVS